MPDSRNALFCSDACRSKELFRSFGACPECRQTWNMQGEGATRHYRNNAWKLCETCAAAQGRCVVCGGKVSR